jgi:hypothetical protein
MEREAGLMALTMKAKTLYDALEELSPCAECNDCADVEDWTCGCCRMFEVAVSGAVTALKEIGEGEMAAELMRLALADGAAVDWIVGEA